MRLVCNCPSHLSLYLFPSFPVLLSPSPSPPLLSLLLFFLLAISISYCFILVFIFIFISIFIFINFLNRDVTSAIDFYLGNSTEIFAICPPTASTSSTSQGRSQQQAQAQPPPQQNPHEASGNKVVLSCGTFLLYVLHPFLSLRRPSLPHLPSSTFPPPPSLIVLRARGM